MTWIEIEDYKVGQLVEPGDLNTLKTNLDFLAQPPLAYYQHSTTGGDYSTNSLRYLVPIDPINMALQVTTSGGILVAILDITIYESSGNLFPAFHYDVDGKLLFKEGSFSRTASPYLLGSGNEESLVIVMPIFGLPPGQHIIQPIWAIDTAGTLVAVDDFAPFFGVWEL